MDNTRQVRKYGHYLVYDDATVIEIKTGKQIKKHLHYGKYVVGLKTVQSKTIIYHQLHRLMYTLFINPEITRYNYVIPLDGNYENLSLNNWQMYKIGEFHKERTNCGRKKKISDSMEKEIMQMHKDGKSLRKIAVYFDVSSCTIHNIISGKYHKNCEKKKEGTDCNCL